MKKKFSKFKNTGLIFEMLSKQMVLDVLQTGNSQATRLIKKHFNKSSQLHKEMACYQTLTGYDQNGKINATKLIDLVVEQYKNLDHAQLQKEKFNLIKDIKSTYNSINDLFGIKTENYQKLGSIYRLFETSINKDNIVEYATLHETVNKQLNVKKDIISEQIEQNDPDVNAFALRLAIKSFNEKYQELNERQKTLVIKYLTQNTNSPEFKEYVLTEIKSIKANLSKGYAENKTLDIKVKEVIKLLDDMVIKPIDESTLSGLIKFYQLEDMISD